MKQQPQGIDFIALEKKWLLHWYKTGVIEKYLHKNDHVKDTFSFQDGPITANNPMGVHHAWGRTYKDVWQKYFNLRGKRQRFQNGFDCQGLWVEVEVEKELGLKTKKDIENLVPGDKTASVAKFVQLCKDRVHKFAGIQTEQSKRLAYFMDWDNSYFTMSDENNYMIWKFLKTCHENGWIYKGHESVPWCPRCETAISQHEMLTEDYKELVHKAIYLELPIVDRKNEFLLIWTTTPWTIPANIAVAVDADLEYSLVKGEGDNAFWVAKDAVERIFEGKGKVVKTVKGSELVGLKYTGPFDSLPAVQEVIKDPKFHTVVATDPRILEISATEGTGLVHTAVSAGVEDFRLGKKLGLPMIPVIEDNADYLSTMGFLSGKNAKKHPELIFDYLKEQEEKGEDWIFNIHNYKHRYPACWRCKTELVWKVADEWYIAMDEPSQGVTSDELRSTSSKGDKRTLRERMIAVAKQITWMPEFGLDRELDWLNNMHDWLISKKNRYWGLSLPIYECDSCGTFEVIGSKQELKEKAVSGWSEFEGKSPHKPYIDAVTISCPTCQGELKRVEDVGNPWLDAGIVPFSTISADNKGEPLYTANKKEWDEWYPADFITESFPGQFKNWFYALIAEASVLEDSAPFKRVLGFGTQLAEDGRPMHKSWGNSIEFNEGADKIGVDVMRFMFAGTNPSENMLFGYRKADEVRRRFYLLFWNVFVFYKNYAELDDYKHKEDSTPTNPLDIWILSRLSEFVSLAGASYEAYDLRQVTIEAERLLSDCSTWFIRRSRTRVFTHSNDTEDKLSFYSSLHTVLVNFSIVLSPILPFITEEIYTALTQRESVHLANWPEAGSIDTKLVTDMARVREIAEVGHRVRKEAGIKLRQPLAKVSLMLPKGKTLISTHKDALITLLSGELNVKAVDIFETGAEIQAEFDTEITPELEAEGQVRDLVRSIQEERKKAQISQDARVSVRIDPKFHPYEAEIRKQVLLDSVEYGDPFELLS